MVQHVHSIPAARDDLLDRLRTAAHWRKLNPQLSVNDTPSPGPRFDIPAERLLAIREEVRREGYFRLEDVVPLELLHRLHTAVTRLRALKLPPIFLFAYDEAWEIGARLAPVIETLLEGPHAQVPGFWVWHLDSSREAAGWPPHRDLGRHTVFPDGKPMIITLWVPLVDATPENGCIYLVPRHLDDAPGFTPTNLQDIRAIPARAGSVLGWGHDVLHWSGRSSRRSATDRVSFAIEFQRTDLPAPLLDGPPYTEPFLDPARAPDLSRRLSLIGQQVLLYSTRYQMPPALLALAQRLVEADGPDAPRVLAAIERWLATQR